MEVAISNRITFYKKCNGLSEYGVNEVFISSIICSKNNFRNAKIKKVNFLLRLLCNENGFTYIDIINIIESDLWKGGLHLVECGKVETNIYAENMLNGNELPNSYTHKGNLNTMYIEDASVLTQQRPEAATGGVL